MVFERPKIANSSGSPMRQVTYSVLRMAPAEVESNRAASHLAAKSWVLSWLIGYYAQTAKIQVVMPLLSFGSRGAIITAFELKPNLLVLMKAFL